MADDHQAAVDAFAEEMRVRTRAAVAGGRRRPRRKVRSVLRACGYEKRSDKAAHAIQRALELRGVQPEPKLTDRGLLLDDSVNFTLAAETDYEPQFFFPDDDSLRDFVFRNFAYFPSLSGYRPVDREFRLDSAKRVDIFCREKGTNRAVVIEVEKKNAETVEQVLEYLSELDAKKKPHEPRALGIIISGRPYPVMQGELQGKEDRLRWFTYRVRFELEQYG